MVVQPKKHKPKKLRIYVDFRGLNKSMVINPFSTSFTDEIINEVAEHECYSFTDNFSGYNQVPIAKEDQEKMAFISKFRSFTYKVIPFGLKNAPAVFSRTMIKSFQEYIYKIMDSYFDD